ncbi:tRNA (cytidine(56)-2'-O)-methyltransferase [Candidatus Micrarchaeota archaeon]|nr:tRNA (cytidine(56)-2'-O)-methyltransferase [Candidatus Micrarchaeota archaeon]
MQIEVLRLGHRLPRDERISTHVALVARAFGASAMAYTGQHDAGLEESIRRICGNWGGEFPITYEKSVTAVIKKHKRDGFTIVHLTMYGLALPDVLPAIKSRGKILVVVGSEQVPREIYELADFNVSITNQPHSEVAALAMTLDRLMEGKELEPHDFGGRIRIVPSARGKDVVETR